MTHNNRFLAINSRQFTDNNKEEKEKKPEDEIKSISLSEMVYDSTSLLIRGKRS